MAHDPAIIRDTQMGISLVAHEEPVCVETTRIEITPAAPQTSTS